MKIFFCQLILLKKENSSITKENEILKNTLNDFPTLLATPQKDLAYNNKEESAKDNISLDSLKENYKKIKEERKEKKEKMKLEEKNKEKQSKIFSYFQTSESSIGDLNEQNSIIDMYEEKILQNSMKTLPIKLDDKSPKLLNNFKKK